MKKFLLAVLAVIAFVVGALGSQQQFKVPDSLPIGTGFPVDILIAVDIGNDDGNLAHKEFYYDSQEGSLETVMKQGLRNLATALVVPKGTENQDYWVSLQGLKVIQTDNGTEYWTVVANHNGYNPELFFKLENGKIPERILDVTLAVGLGGVPVYAKGLSEVTAVLVDELGNELSSETSPNGITDKACSQYPGGNAYIPDALIVDAFVAYPPFWATYKKFFNATVEFEPRRGYYILRFGPDKAIWAKYDLETGRKLDSNEPKVVTPEPVKLEITLVDLASIKLSSFTKKNSASSWGLRLLVRGPVGQSVVLEYADTINGSWQKLTDVSLTYGSAEHVDELVPTVPARFYRAK